MTRTAQVYVIISSLAVIGLLAIVRLGNQITPPQGASAVETAAAC